MDINKYIGTFERERGKMCIDIIAFPFVYLT